MARCLSLVPTVLLLLAAATTASALTVVVPDDHPTIQEAIDGGADVIQVRGGLAPERLTVARFVVIEAASIPLPFIGNWIATPSIQSMELTAHWSEGVAVRGFRFLGRVIATAMGSGEITFEACRFDSGFVGPSNTGSPFVNSSIRGCMFLGDVSVTGYVQFVGNTVIGGTASIWADGGHDIQNNYVQGPAEDGLRLTLQLSNGKVAQNIVRGTTNGIRFVGDDGGTSTLRNDIADCAGDGIVYDFQSSPPSSIHCDSNSVVRCGGAGIAIRSSYGGDIWSYAGASGNIVRQTGLGGIDLRRATVMEARGNTILDAGGDGFVLGRAANFQDNVIGRSAGAGLRVTIEPLRITSNTFFSNGGAGIHLENSYASDSITHNISALNLGPGLLLVSGSDQPELSCNDWFGNVGGTTVGISPGASDLFLNPLFCDLGSGDVHLSSGSPLLAAPGCGLIGALGQGCEATTGVEEARVDGSRGFHAWPIPARGPIGFTLPAAMSLSEVEVFDVTGARRWQSTIPAGATRLEWDRRETGGRMVAPGVYFARLRQGGAEIAKVRIVLTE